MKKLVQRVVEINPVIESIPEKLQKFLDDKSKDGWEYSGQIGMFYVFKRWEEETQVVQNEGGYGGYNPGYQTYNPNQGYRPYPNFQQFNPQPTPQTYFNPNNFGVRVEPENNNKKICGSNPFDEED